MKRLRNITSLFLMILAAGAFAAALKAAASFVSAQTRSGDEIMKRVDRNQGSDTKIIIAEMIIHSRRDSRSIKSKSWIQGVKQSFTEYLEPAREKGTKMLKLGDELWTYSPSTDRTIKISGNMLRQSVMGSDLSYEDMMEDPKLANVYEAGVAGEETVLERPCWVLELKAKKEDVAYAARKIWVDKERDVILREEMYARSGKLLKTLEVKNVARIQNRWIQDRMVFRDVLKSGGGTEFAIESIEFNARIPDFIFSKAALKK